MSGLAGFRVGVTSARKAAELVAMLERRGAEVLLAPALSEQPYVDPARLRTTTEALLADGLDVLVATTGTGVRSWFEAVRGWGRLEELVGVLRDAEIVARGPKTVGALRAHGLRELWTPGSELLADVMSRLRLRDLAGCRVVLQEHGQSLALEAEALRRAGARVSLVSTYRCTEAEDLAPVFGLVEQVCDGGLDAVTFTSAPAATTVLRIAEAAGRRADLVAALRRDVPAVCVGPATGAALAAHGVPAVWPDRARLGAMVHALEGELATRRRGRTLQVAERLLVIRGDEVRVDGSVVRLTGAPLAVLHALVEEPGRVVSRKQLMGRLPSGLAGTEHAVEMAVARLRASVGPGLVQTVVKRGYRLPVASPVAGTGT